MTTGNVRHPHNQFTVNFGQLVYCYHYATLPFCVQGLKELVVGEEQVLFQASNALSQCIKRTTSSGASFIGSAEAVECHRLLLVASTNL